MDIRQFMRDMEKSSKETFENMREIVFEAVYDSVQFSRKEIEKQLDVEGFSRNIIAIPEKIRVQKEICKQTRTTFEEAKSNLVNAESMIAAVIAAETTDAGKQKFSNDTTRRAELEIRKKHNFEYQQAWGPYKETLDEMDAEQFKLEQLYDELKAYQVVGGVLAARLSLMRLEV
ncbi:MAG: hypothetical protein NC238_02855 [Dehalobacter sp.]|nr:hypothetical protein [Dehalobacter sp.]